ncbi:MULTISPECIES: (2Fe-2S)-binding protein [Stappiaceae]|uniref:(2Fe-2S)-binding protein n=1 Tax=Stappiaceae TaxID=2821832 RepID=UPI001ADA2B8E|nr:(2Fe-2S)-binding protein [Labrenzia sp. R4_2]MBO9420421.1 (2Fe-2S)-binding protein [Labrenzia sp. R4_2]
MLICSCNVLSDKQLREAAAEMRDDPNGKIPTPGSVFRHLGCRPRCGGCFPSVIDIIHENTPENEKPKQRQASSGRKAENR